MQRAGIEGPGLISPEGLKKFFGRQLKRLCSLQHRYMAERASGT
ncbi:unnamed protein product [Musa acuminata subsp. malaccensis]|uniref:(wild Malaysian banana) hypothetical protein n=1 Tax=Musa acuminata subsp. malaccensis TaxID=214687 RepID=A0A804JK97_MUSAM|nr:unnamed protein product [Musa acuminata subsp. malaccensis]